MISASRPFPTRAFARLAPLLVAVVALSGCGAIVSRATDSAAERLSQAILNQNDPETVRDAAPAYLILLDSVVQGSPDSASALSSASTLYAAYGITFVDDPERAKRLTERSRDYAERAVCAQRDTYCAWGEADYDGFVAALEETRPRDAAVLYAYAVGWLAYLRAHADDWGALAELPKVEAVLARLALLDADYEAGNVQLYLGILNTLRPPALGGRPEVGREHFERAIALTGGADLSVKLEYARGYARMMYDRDLHDRLLTEVVEADPEIDGLTLLNVLAQREARDLLASADDYF